MGKKKTPDGIRNHVAQHSWEINKSQVHRDRKNDYRRKDKHNNKRYDLPPVMILIRVLSHEANFLEMA